MRARPATTAPHWGSTGATVGATGLRTLTSYASGVDPAAADAVSAQANQLGLVVSRPSPEVLVVTAAGAIDLANVDRVGEVLRPRLSAAMQTVVLDLGQVAFLSIAGVGLLQQSQLRAQARRLALRLVVTSHEVHRALTVSGLDQLVPCFATLSAALPPSGTGCSSPHRRVDDDTAHGRVNRGPVSQS